MLYDRRGVLVLRAVVETQMREEGMVKRGSFLGLVMPFVLLPGSLSRK